MSFTPSNRARWEICLLFGGALIVGLLRTPDPTLFAPMLLAQIILLAATTTPLHQEDPHLAAQFVALGCGVTTLFILIRAWA